MTGRKQFNWWKGVLYNKLTFRAPAQLFWIHVPKTAGVSFYPLLFSNYGLRAFRLNFGQLPDTPSPKKRLLNKTFNSFPVVGGHLPYQMVRDYLRPETKVITWVRNPLDRVVSNYRFSHRNWLRDNERVKTLEEYIEQEQNQNRMAHYLKGLPLSDFFFVGLVEHYPSDISSLGELLGWRQVYELRENVSRGPKLEVKPSLQQKILDLNREDLALYEEAISLREKRIGT